MGTRINVLMPHNLTDWADRDTVLRILSSTLSDAKAVAMYWIDDASQPLADESWIARPPFPPPETRDYHCYSGPGPLFVAINPYSIHVRTGGRWRGFLSIQPLRTVHIRVFHSIANAFDARIFRCFPDDDIATGAFWDAAEFDSCCAILDDRYGKALLLNDAVDPKIAAETDSGCPSLQYVSGREP